jgi:hypothetical protein
VSNTNAGTATVTATGKGNYSGTATANFAISPKTLSDSMIETIHPVLYTGSPITPTVRVFDGTTRLVANTHYAFEYSNNTAAGTATVTVTGMGNYAGTATAHFLITPPEDISTLQITPIPDQTYTGSPITPLPEIKDEDYTLVLGEDYTIDEYEDNTAVGTAYVLVSAIEGVYTGTAYIPFKIIAPPPPSSSSATPPPPSSSSTTPSSSSTVISSSSTPPPSSSSAIQPSSSSAVTPILMSQITAANIRAYAAHNAIVLENLPQNAKVEVYNLQGQRVYVRALCATPQRERIEVQTKGIYIVKAAYGSEKKMLRVVVK